MPVLLGKERKWKVMKDGKLKLKEVEHNGYIIDFLSSIKVCYGKGVSGVSE